MKSKIKTLMTDLYNRGYAAGHHDTVEGQYVDIHYSDQLTYHEDVIDEIIEEMVKDGQLARPHENT
tara:strand:+ start:111 stop:308 length:198 start_codon:yes stop_codon:yes gene_type:complete